MEKEIAQIIAIEWAMFDKVNEGKARASCQEDSETFFVMRKSQFEAWDETTVASYLKDLIKASSQGRNLIEEKYKMMMCGAELDNIIEKAGFPTPEIVQAVDRISEVMMDWTVEMRTQFPQLEKNSRPVFSYEDVLGVTSVQTYLKCELLTYSLETLQSLWNHITRLKQEGKNMPLIILQNTLCNTYQREK